MHNINEFLKEYDKAVIAGDIIKISTHFHHHFSLSTQTELWYLANGDEFRSNLTAVFNGYEKLGSKECRILSTDIIRFTSDHYIANIEWG